MTEHTMDEKRKSDSALRTIGEVSEELDLPPHVLRFWESKFSQIKPQKRRGGHRYYRPQDVEIIRKIKTLLYDQGYTIKGAQNFLKASKRKDADDSLLLENIVADTPIAANSNEELKEILSDLQEIKSVLSR